MILYRQIIDCELKYLSSQAAIFSTIIKWLTAHLCEKKIFKKRSSRHIGSKFAPQFSATEWKSGGNSRIHKEMINTDYKRQLSTYQPEQ